MSFSGLTFLSGHPMTRTKLSWLGHCNDKARSARVLVAEECREKERDDLTWKADAIFFMVQGQLWCPLSTWKNCKVSASQLRARHR